MSPISNFTQAMRELTGFDEESNKAKEKRSEPQVQIKKDEMKSREAQDFTVPQGEYRQRKQTDIGIPTFDESEGTIITRTMSINGKVSGTDSVKISGSMTGDLQTASSAVVNGKIQGNIQAESLSISGSVKGNLQIKTDARLETAAVLIGDIHSGNILVRGKTKGNLYAERITDLAESAVVVGDIVTGELNAERGSIIKGNVQTETAEKIDFDETKIFNIGEEHGRTEE